LRGRQATAGRPHQTTANVAHSPAVDCPWCDQPPKAPCTSVNVSQVATCRQCKSVKFRQLIFPRDKAPLRIVVDATELRLGWCWHQYWSAFSRSWSGKAVSRPGALYRFKVEYRFSPSVSEGPGGPTVSRSRSSQSVRHAERTSVSGLSIRP